MPSAYSVPMASDVLPDPDTPTTATSRHSGTSTSTSRRLLCRAPRTSMTAGRVPGTGISPAAISAHLKTVLQERSSPDPGDSPAYAGLVARATLRLIDRGDLLGALDRAAAKTVTIISAPAGSGKQSLLRAWAGRPGQRRRLAVMQVQRDQQDAQQFWLALLGAVRQASGAAAGAEPPAATPEFNG